jgi:hypothetical protein
MKINNKGTYKKTIADHLLHIFAANTHCYFNSIHLFDILNYKKDQDMRFISVALRNLSNDKHIRWEDGKGGYQITEQGMRFFQILRERPLKENGDPKSKQDVDKQYLASIRNSHRYNERGDKCRLCGINKEVGGYDGATKTVWYWDKNDKIYFTPPSCRRDGKYN